MRIGVQGQYDLYTGFNAREAIGRIPTVPAAEQVNKDVDENVREVAEVSKEVINEDILRKGNGDVSEIAMRLKTSNGFGSAENVLKAYSDLEKDESLKQYQYFVGDGEVIDSSEDGIVIQKSGFGLF